LKKKEIHHEPLPPSQKLVFGVPLQKIELAEDNLPKIVKMSVEFLLEKGLDTPGIFRIPGRQDVINNFMHKFDNGEEVDFIKADPPDIAGCLKLFLKSLPHPLIPSLFDAQIPFIISTDGGRTEEEILTDLKDVLLALPEPNLSIIKSLIHLMCKITQNSDRNFMTADNIIKCIVPTIGCTPAIFSLPMKNYEFFFGM